MLTVRVIKPVYNISLHGNKLTKNGSSDNFTFHWMIRFESIFTPKDAKATIMVSYNKNNATVNDHSSALYMLEDIIWYVEQSLS